MYYYKVVDIDNNIISEMSCSIRLLTSNSQIEISKSEYDEYINSLPEPEIHESAMDDALTALSVLGYSEV